MKISSPPLLRKFSTNKGLLLLFLLSQGVLLLMMTWTVPALQAGTGSPIFDLRTFGYSFAEAQAFIHQLSPEGRNLYIFPQILLLDVLYPLLLAFFLGSSLFRLQNALRPTRMILKPLTGSPLVLWIPFLAMVFDFLENGAILLMITDSVELSSGLVALSSVLTLLKGLVTSLSWLLVLILLVNWLWNRLLPRPSRN